MAEVRRDTRQRKLVLDIAQRFKIHPTAEEIYQLVHKEHPSISLGTVYRNLNVLVEQGELLRIHVPGSDRFDGKTDPHYHMTCRCCRRVFDVEEKYMPCIHEQAGKHSVHRIEGHMILFQGICSDCQKKQASQQEKNRVRTQQSCHLVCCKTSK